MTPHHTLAASLHLLYFSFQGDSTWLLLYNVESSHPHFTDRKLVPSKLYKGILKDDSALSGYVLLHLKCLRSCVRSRFFHHRGEFIIIKHFHNNLSDFECTRHFTGTYETEAFHCRLLQAGCPHSSNDNINMKLTLCKSNCGIRGGIQTGLLWIR